MDGTFVFTLLIVGAYLLYSTVYIGSIKNVNALRIYFRRHPRHLIVNGFVMSAADDKMEILVLVNSLKSSILAQPDFRWVKSSGECYCRTIKA